MRSSTNFLMVGLFCLALGTMAVSEAAAKKTDGLFTVSEAVKVVEQTVGTDVLSVDLLSSKKGDPYYRITVDNTPSAERKDVFVDAKTGKINQVIEHSSYEVGDDPAVR